MKKINKSKIIQKPREIKRFFIDAKLAESDSKLPYNIDSRSSLIEHFNKLFEATLHFIDENIENKGTEILLNPYPRIFKNHDSFLFFESLKSDVRERYKLADFSFIYRRLQRDGLIFKYVTDSEFRDFLQTFSIEIDKTKLLDYCKTELKENNYTAKRKLFLHL